MPDPCPLTFLCSPYEKGQELVRESGGTWGMTESCLTEPDLLFRSLQVNGDPSECINPGYTLPDNQ